MRASILPWLGWPPFAAQMLRKELEMVRRLNSSRALALRASRLDARPMFVQPLVARQIVRQFALAHGPQCSASQVVIRNWIGEVASPEDVERGLAAVRPQILASLNRSWTGLDLSCSK